MAKRKTINVEWVKSRVDKMNRESSCEPKVREGWNHLLEEILMETENYNGFRYLNIDEIRGDGPEKGHKVPDETRRKYN